MSVAGIGRLASEYIDESALITLKRTARRSRRYAIVYAITAAGQFALAGIFLLTGSPKASVFAAVYGCIWFATASANMRRARRSRIDAVRIRLTAR